ncbi:MAG: IS30 family transposase, partial [Alphaproteobacteria bacterium]|nr:IS30 family transposase [Alphaproteobacteria bacterium]
MTGYSHLSFWERQEIARLHATGWSLARIGAIIGRGRWTVSRELRRNGNKDSSYKPESAEGRYLARRRRTARLDRTPELARFVVERLHENWTPEQISGWLKAGNERGLGTLCHEAIYAWVHAGAQRTDKLWKLLPRLRAKRGRKPARKPHNTIKDRRSIHERGQNVAARAQGGHWEGDLMFCRRTRPVLVLTERKSRFTIVARLAGKTAAETAQAIMDVFAKLDPDLRR